MKTACIAWRAGPMSSRQLAQMLKGDEQYVCSLPDQSGTKKPGSEAVRPGQLTRLATMATIRTDSRRSDKRGN
jgi:hypothetical protein